MLTVFLFLLLIGFVLAVLFWVGTLAIQGYWYSEPAPGLAWRGPAAAAAIMVFLALWCLLNMRVLDPEKEGVPYDTIFKFSPSESYPAKGFPKFWSVKNGQETLYEREQIIDSLGHKISGNQYLNSKGRPWGRSDGDGQVEAVLIEEPVGDKMEKTRFNLVPPAGGRFKEGEFAVYKEDGGKGRTLTEQDLRIGQFTKFRWDILIVSVLLNLLNMVLAFACLWLLMRYQWPHALGLAFVVWLVLTLGVMPSLFYQVHAAVPKPATPPAQRP